MVSVTVLLATATVFWGGAAPGVAEQNCPDGVRYNVKPLAEMLNSDVHDAAAEAPFGGCVITFRAGWREELPDRIACEIVLHEYGHAALKLRHTEGGIMDEFTRDEPPGICMQYRSTVGREPAKRSSRDRRTRAASQAGRPTRG
jgi:hypothetical protein